MPFKLFSLSQRYETQLSDRNNTSCVSFSLRTRSAGSNMNAAVSTPPRPLTVTVGTATGWDPYCCNTPPFSLFIWKYRQRGEAQLRCQSPLINGSAESSGVELVPIEILHLSRTVSPFLTCPPLTCRGRQSCCKSAHFYSVVNFYFKSFLWRWTFTFQLNLFL